MEGHVVVEIVMVEVESDGSGMLLDFKWDGGSKVKEHCAMWSILIGGLNEGL